MKTTDTPDAIRIGVLGGTRLPRNVETFLRNLSRLLEPHPVNFQFELLVRDDATDGILGYDIVDPGISRSNRAVGTIRTLTATTTRYARENSVDALFQVTKFPVHGIAATVAGYRTGTPVITRYAGDNFREYQFSEGMIKQVRTFTLNNLIGALSARLANSTIVLGPNGKSEIERRTRGGDVRIIPQPVDFERFHPVSDSDRERIRERLDISMERRTLLTVGRLSKRKGIDNLIKAAQALASEGRKIEWIVVGDGPFYESLQSTPLVKAIGRVSHEQMPDYYRAADLLVHPSPIEGLPNVLLEATACGTPTVARDVGEVEMVASETYTPPTKLSEVVLGTYEPTSLGQCFAPENLREVYAEAIVKTAMR